MQIAIVAYPGLTALDAIGPYEVLNQVKDRDLRFVWKEPGPIVADSGVLVIGATHSFDETSQPDVVVVPGSSASTATMMADDDLIAWLKRVHRETRFTASVCSGALILGAAGILEGKPATTHWMAMPGLKTLGAEPRPQERVVRSGKVFTAAGVSAGIDLGLTLLSELKDADTAKVAQLLIEYDPQSPFDCGHMSKASAAIASRARKEMLFASLNPRDAISIPKALFRRWKDRLTRGPSSSRVGPTAPTRSSASRARSR